MYTPPHFAQTESATIDRILDEYPLATLVAQTPGGLLANHLPLMRREGALIGHCALANPMHRLIAQGSAVLAIFRGPDGYVSPNWYPSKADTHKAVPTWNYQAVHVHGRLTFSHAERDKRRAVSVLTARHETLTNGARGWRMGDAPEDFVQDMLDAIVAFTLPIERIEAKSKLSQNRDPADRQSVADAFDAQENGSLAKAMRDTLGD